MVAPDKNKPSRKDRLRRIISGVQKHFSTGPLTLAGQTFNTSADLVNRIQGDIAASDASDDARAGWHGHVQVERDSHTALAPILRALKSQVVAKFGDTPDASATLGDFGYSPRKLPVRGVAAKAEAVDKLRATRTVRHTMGAQQKKAVKGTVEVPVTAASTAPAAAPSVATTSPSPASAGTAASAATPAAAPMIKS